VITESSIILPLRVEKHKKLFPLLDYVENSKIKSVNDLSYFESFFSLGNRSELSKSMSKNMWDTYKEEKDSKDGF
jgi:hypothetical protein